MAWPVDLAIGAAGGLFTGLVGPYLLRYAERRQARANVHRALVDVERLREAKVDSDHNEFNRAVRELEATALIAGLPRDLVQAYTALAETYWRASSLEMDAWGFGKQRMPMQLSYCVGKAAETLTDAAWQPLLARATQRRRYNKLWRTVNKELAACERDGAFEDGTGSDYDLWVLSPAKATLRLQTRGEAK